MSSPFEVKAMAERRDYTLRFLGHREAELGVLIWIEDPFWKSRFLVVDHQTKQAIELTYGDILCRALERLYGQPEGSLQLKFEFSYTDRGLFHLSVRSPQGHFADVEIRALLNLIPFECAPIFIRTKKGEQHEFDNIFVLLCYLFYGQESKVNRYDTRTVSDSGTLINSNKTTSWFAPGFWMERFQG